MSTINNGIPFVPENTIDPAAGLNLSINHIDAVLQLAVLSVGDNAPPASSNPGDRHIVGTSPSGLWSGGSNKIARFLDGAWKFYPANFCINLSDLSIYAFDGTGWKKIQSSDVEARMTTIESDIVNIKSMLLEFGIRISELENKIP